MKRLLVIYFLIVTSGQNGIKSQSFVSKFLGEFFSADLHNNSASTFFSLKYTNELNVG